MEDGPQRDGAGGAELLRLALSHDPQRAHSSSFRGRVWSRSCGRCPGTAPRQPRRHEEGLPLRSRLRFPASCGERGLLFWADVWGRGHTRDRVSVVAEDDRIRQHHLLLLAAKPGESEGNVVSV